MKYLERRLSGNVIEAGRYFSVILITGPRQSGKTTMCRHLYPDYNFVNLENISQRRMALDDPEGFIDSLGSKAIIDEAQNAPEILSSIQARVDNNKELKYVLTGSSNFSLIRHVSQSLAGRVAVFTLLPLSIAELSDDYVNKPTNLIEHNGFYPGVIINNQPVDLFYESYLTTYVERDVRDLLKVKNIDKFDKFLRLCAGRIASEFNASSLATEVGVSSNTISEWIGILKASYIAYTLQPYYINIGKRLTKTPKLYFYDTGLLTHLLGIESAEQLSTHPLRGAIFENMIISEFMKGRYNQGKRPNYFFYRENSGKEIDVVEESSDRLNLFEVKAASTYRSEFLKNMEYLSRIGGVTVEHNTLIYDGVSIVPTIYNYRDYFKK